MHNYICLSTLKKHFAVYTQIDGTETSARNTKSSRGGGEHDQYLRWHLFPAWLACLPCHQPSLQPRLFSCQLARLAVALTLAATSREVEMGHNKPASHASHHHTHTQTLAEKHTEIYVFQSTCGNGWMHRASHAYSHTVLNLRMNVCELYLKVSLLGTLTFRKFLLFTNIPAWRAAQDQRRAQTRVSHVSDRL